MKSLHKEGLFKVFSVSIMISFEEALSGTLCKLKSDEWMVLSLPTTTPKRYMDINMLKSKRWL